MKKYDLSVILLILALIYSAIAVIAGSTCLKIGTSAIKGTNGTYGNQISTEQKLALKVLSIMPFISIVPIIYLVYKVRNELNQLSTIEKSLLLLSIIYVLLSVISSSFLLKLEIKDMMNGSYFIINMSEATKNMITLGSYSQFLLVIIFVLVFSQ
jgi:hypothetical protein